MLQHNNDSRECILGIKEEVEMELDRHDNCPLGKDLQPGCAKCLACEYILKEHIADHTISCKIENAGVSIRKVLFNHKLGDPVGIPANKIMQMLIKDFVK